MSATQAITWWPWVNHSTNPFSGATVTVPAASGVLVISALTLLVRMAGEAAWKITAFALHHLRSSNTPEDALTRQFQVYLRNASTAFGSVIDMTTIGWTWRGRANKGLLRALGLVWLALSIAVSFTVAGIFVGRVAVPAYETNQILLQPTNCGIESSTRVGMTTGMANYDLGAKHANDMRQAKAYASTCYAGTNKSMDCNSLPVRSLPYTIDTGMSCPFGARCKHGAVQLDTGLLDSHTHLGINARDEDRVGFRVSTTCSVLHATDVTKVVPDPKSNGNYSIFQVYFGGLVGATNYTWSHSELESYQQSSYTLNAYVHLPPDSAATTWDTIPDLTLQNADTTVLFFAPNSVWYYGPNEDPMFSANGTYTETSDSQTWYIPDYYFTTLACADQLQICDTATSDCSPLTGNHMTAYTTLGLNMKQQATAERIILAQQQSHIYDVATGRGGSALAATDLLVNLVSPQLPDNQWILEVTQLFQTALANIQLRIVDFPTNTWFNDDMQNVNVLAAKAWQPATDGLAMNQLCRQQRVQSTAEYQSFSLAGVILVCVLSPAFIITSWFLGSCVSKRKSLQPNGLKRYRQLAWIADGKLQLLRMALAGAGYHGWEREMDDVPRRSGGKDIPPPMEDGDAVFYRSIGPHSGSEDGMAHETIPLDPNKEGNDDGR